MPPSPTRPDGIMSHFNKARKLNIYTVNFYTQRWQHITHTKKVETMDLIRVLLSILLPPLGVFLQVGIGGAFWLNILLTLLGYIPGIVHAIWIIAKR